jgi:mRNA-degrading endonuclease RelE of RelBE toxin-antitoxin system
LHRFAESGEGDVRKLQGQSGELRLRVGDYRVRFTQEADDSLQIHAVLHRKEAYR